MTPYSSHALLKAGKARRPRRLRPGGHGALGQARHGALGQARHGALGQTSHGALGQASHASSLADTALCADGLFVCLFVSALNPEPMVADYGCRAVRFLFVLSICLG